MAPTLQRTGYSVLTPGMCGKDHGRSLNAHRAIAQVLTGQHISQFSLLCQCKNKSTALISKEMRDSLLWNEI